MTWRAWRAKSESSCWEKAADWPSRSAKKCTVRNPASIGGGSEMWFGVFLGLVIVGTGLREEDVEGFGE